MVVMSHYPTVEAFLGRPPCSAGRPKDELLDIYLSHNKCSLSKYDVISDDVAISQVQTYH